ncbi:MAG: glucosyltransferase domain-containing protein [Treponema sp.]|nr:glucosyltransferase domain-containing protein [Treponema sp.]
MNKKAKIFLAVLSAGCAAVCLFVCLPPVRSFIVSLLERALHRGLNRNYWSQQIFAFSAIVLFFNICMIFFVFTRKGRSFYLELSSDIRAKSGIFRENKKYILFLFILFSFGLISIFRADFYNVANDDLFREITGERAWRNFYRYVSEFGSIIVHMSPKLLDIAPLTQFIAVLIMAASAFVLIYSCTDSKVTVFSCIASIPVCLFPYFLSDISYRYDSPYMALSVFFSVVPFLFTGNLLTYAFISVTGLFLMCLSYQASSGIYIFCTVIFALKFWTEGKKTDKQILKFTGVSVLCYLGALFLFSKLFIEKPDHEIYVDTAVSVSSFIPNCKTYLSLVWKDFGHSAIKLFSVLILICFTVLEIKHSRKNKLLTAALIIAGIAFSLIFSYGSYLALKKPLWLPRAFIGIGVFTGLVSIMVSRFFSEKDRKHIFAKIVVSALSYSVLVFAFAFGNAQAAQKEYRNFRTTMLISELSRLVPASGKTVEIHFTNAVGTAAAALQLIRAYPLAAKCINGDLGPGQSGELVLSQHNFGTIDYSKTAPLPDKELPVLSDTLYETIRGTNSVFVVTFREPDCRIAGEH